MRVAKLPDCPLTTDDCATKIGAGLCSNHASKARCTIKEADNTPARRFETAGYSGANISGYSKAFPLFYRLSAVIGTTLFANQTPKWMPRGGLAIPIRSSQDPQEPVLEPTLC